MKKSRVERMEEFLRYHKYGDGECNTLVLRAWADLHCKDLQERYELSYFFSVTYCVFSAIIMFENKDSFFEDCEAFSDQYKNELIFQSDRKYIKMKDSFKKANKCFVENNRSVDKFIKKVSSGRKKIGIKEAVEYVSSWDMFGRFSAFLFLEAFIGITGLPFENYTIDWKHGDTATSGLLNLYGYDEYAIKFDKENRLMLKESFMDSLFSDLVSKAEEEGASGSVVELETSLCAYRKFYKGSRYNGFYLDRMLEEICALQGKYRAIAKELLRLRADLFDPKYLGEKGGWNCIRKGLKKLYVERGIVS